MPGASWRMSPSGLSLLALLLVLLLGEAGLLVVAAAAHNSSCQALDPSPYLEKFVDALPIPPTINVSAGRWVKIGAYKIKQKLHRDLNETTLYAFGTSEATAIYPGPTLVATKHVRSRIRWENHIDDSEHFLTVDRTLHWANPARGGVPIVVHLHGSETDSRYDGHPEAWWTAGGETGPTFHSRNYRYPNQQRATNLWYHDHALGLTRVNVLAGLAGFYFLKDAPGEEPVPFLPHGPFEIPVLFQDKSFWPDGSINFPSIGNVPSTHPSWCPEYFGDVMLANGKAWPYLDVLQARYRFRLVNAANARFLELTFSDPQVVFFQIGTDGGYLDYPRNLTSLTIGPGERADVIVDFRHLPLGSVVYLNNSAAAPYPGGDPVTEPTSVLLKLVVVGDNASSALAASAGERIGSSYYVPQALLTADEQAINASETSYVRRLLVEEFADPATDSPIYSLLGGKHWMEAATETPTLGSTEVWEIINLTEDAHPVHLHLVRFKVLGWQAIDSESLSNGSCDPLAPFGNSGSCYTGPSQPARVQQEGWKDTAVVFPGEVTRFLVRFTSQNGLDFAFDPTRKPGYVWHCHILDHEDNDMMRPLVIKKQAHHH